MIYTRSNNAEKLYARLKALSEYKGFAFGHQNAGHLGVSIKAHDGSESDVKNIMGAHPMVIGVDTLSFSGYEGEFDDTVKVVQNLDKQGVIITLSSHMPNFSLGEDDYIDYTPNITEGNVGTRIMPGGDLNAKYTRFLDRIAKFANLCRDENDEPIAMIFRPFHEDNGSWFWWGAEHLPNKEYIELFRYTIEYLTKDQGVQNFLFAYSPNGPFTDFKDYMARYPGDEYIDIMGLDLYHDRPHKRDGFFDKLATTIDVIASCATNHSKIYAVTELGLRTLDDSSDDGYYEGLAPSHNKVPDWYTQVLSTVMSKESLSGIAYLLTWANFSEGQFWVPYQTESFKHEMVDDFVKFASDERVLLAGQEPN